MPKTNATVEQRLARLEKEVVQLKAVVGQRRTTKKTPWWQEVSGTFKDDPAFAEICRLGAEIRRRQRKP